MHLTEKLAEFITGTGYADVPPEARSRAKACILDCVGVTIGGTRQPIVVPVMAYLEQIGGREECSIIGFDRRSSVTGAALMNGILGHVLDFDDSTPVFTGHPTVAILSAIFALAEKFGASGKDIVTAYMVGTEVQWRLGDAMATCGDHYRKGWHSTGTIGAFGAAAAAARVLALDKRKTAHALGIVASEAGGFQEQFGTHCKSFHAGRANECGVRAALLARGGFESSGTALEGKVGYFRLVADEYDVEKIGNFAQPWGLLEPTPKRSMNIKMAPICGGGIGTIENVQFLMKTHGITAEDVDFVECFVQPKELDLVQYHNPQTSLQAKFSMEYWVAMTLLEGRVGLRQITDDVVQQPRVRDLTKRVRLIPDPSIPWPPAQMRIKIHLNCGRAYGTEYQARKGTPANPMTESELIAKFEECAELVSFPQQKARDAVRILLNMEQIGSVTELMRSITLQR